MLLLPSWSNAFITAAMSASVGLIPSSRSADRSSALPIVPSLSLSIRFRAEYTDSFRSAICSISRSITTTTIGSRYHIGTIASSLEASERVRTLTAWNAFVCINAPGLGCARVLNCSNVSSEAGIADIVSCTTCSLLPSPRNASAISS